MAQNRHQAKVLVASAAAYSMATIGWWLQPSLIHEVMLRFSVGESAGGLVASAEIAMIAVCSALFAKFIGRFSFLQIALFGITVCLLGGGFSLSADTYHQLLISRSITGVGEGAMLAVASAALANFRDPDRAYGVINVASILFCSAAVFSLPITAGYFEVEFNVFQTIFVCVVILSLLVPFITGNSQQVHVQDDRSTPAHGVFSWKLQRLLVGVFVVAGGAGAMWSFYYLLGTAAGLSENEIHNAVGTAAVISVSGAFLATLVGTRFGRLLPVTLGTIVLTVAVLALSQWPHPLVFRLSAIINVVGMYFLLPYFLGYAAAQDPSGRDAAITAGVFLLTGAAGPYFGGYVIENFGAGSIGWIVLIANLLVYPLFLLVNRSLQLEQSDRINVSEIKGD
jgi:predicted MFS family arabinose efflux permease